MKNLIFSLLTLIVFCVQSNAQPGGAIWMGSKSANSEATLLHKAWIDVWNAYQAGDTEKMWAFYSEEAAEIGPDGSFTVGKKALREGWDMFGKMMDSKPTFTFENSQVRMLTDDVALVVWDSSADIKVGGQQVGGKTKGMAVVRKVNGHWQIEFDSLTPVMAMPGAGN